MTRPARRVVRARSVLPIASAPLHNAWIEIADGRIAGIGTGRAPADADDFGDCAILPGLVNAHTHLELSWLAGKVPPANSMPDWIRAQLAVRRAAPVDVDAAANAARAAIATAMATGTAIFGDISNSLTTPGVPGVVFHEILGFRVVDAEPVVREAWARVDAVPRDGSADGDTTRDGDIPPTVMQGGVSPSLHQPASFSVVAHAPYSVSPALFAEIARQRRGAPLAVHVGESPEEIEFLQTGQGAFRRLLDDLGAWNDAWSPPGCGPIEYLRRVGYLQPGMLAVHAGHLEDEELIALRDAGGVVVTCPRSNVWVGAGRPDVARFYRARVAVAIGTDSLASVDTLNMFDELAAVRQAAPGIAPGRIIESATLIGARALGLASDFGSIEAGKCADLVAVDLPAGVTDVEEYVVSGIPAGAVRRFEIG